VALALVPLTLTLTLTPGLAATDWTIETVQTAVDLRLCIVHLSILYTVYLIYAVFVSRLFPSQFQ
jgi:hypothetical protein